MLNLELIGQGKTTKVYRDGDRAVKLYVGAPPDEAISEAKLQTFAVDAGLPVPKVYGVRQLDGGVALEMECIPGHELVWPRMDKTERMAAFEQLVNLQCQIHRINAQALPKQADKLTWKIERAARLDESTKRHLIERLGQLDQDKTSLCHGDFHTSNVLRAGDRLWIIDWVDATRGDPLADACRSYLILRQYISRMAGIYLRLFCKAANVDQQDVLAWLPIVAAARLSENLNSQEANFLLEIAGGKIP